MANQRLQAIPLADYPSGIRDFGPFNLRAADKFFYLELQRSTSGQPTIWPSASTGIKIALEVSSDGGSTWLAGGGMEAQGGIHVRASGSEADVTTLQVPLPTGGAQRRMRGSVEIVDGPLRTQGFVELRDT